MKRWTLICVLVACGTGAPAAAAQGSSSTLITFGSYEGHSPVSSTNVPAQTSGRLTVSFHGDAATGCAASGVCGYSGTVVFTAGAQGNLGVSKYRVRGRVSYQVQLDFPAGTGSTLTAARVTRAGGGACGDAEQPGVALPGTVTGGEVTIGLIQREGGLLATRCAGPLDSDLAGLGPEIRLTLGQVLHGRRTLPLSGSWSFAAGGFAGTVESNLTMTLGRPVTERTSFPKGFKTQRARLVNETLTLAGGSGTVSMSLGSDSTTCQFLDSCGLQGTLTGTVAPQGATATLSVIGPAKRPYADFLAALGLSREGNPRGLQVVGTLDWLGGGTLSAQLQQGSSCTSSAPLPGGLVVLATRGQRLTAIYSPLAWPRTRCPGPELGPEFGQIQTLASGGVSRATLGRPTFSLHLSGSGPLSDDGYTISQRTSLTLTLKRGRVHQRTLVEPTP